MPPGQAKPSQPVKSAKPNHHVPPGQARKEDATPSGHGRSGESHGHGHGLGHGVGHGQGHGWGHGKH
ncbi:MAG TPA: hypothetical protein VKB43_06950 [Gaiellaceae bacterium]|nr:hypothetical protein [Gaiellaceae bacterium]